MQCETMSKGMGQKVRNGFVLERRTSATLVELQKLFDELRTVSGAGFALDLGECEDGLHCVAAPVRDASGMTVAAISISGPASRLPAEKLHSQLAAQVVAAADRLSREASGSL